jgi:hypothetical protein
MKPGILASGRAAPGDFWGKNRVFWAFSAFFMGRM